MFVPSKEIHVNSADVPNVYCGIEKKESEAKINYTSPKEIHGKSCDAPPKFLEHFASNRKRAF